MDKQNETETYWHALHVLRTGTPTEGVDAAHALIKLALHGSEKVSLLARRALLGQGVQVQPAATTPACADTANDLTQTW